MTLNKAISELFAEIGKPNITKEEKDALRKYEKWLLSIHGTVSNNKEYWQDGTPVEEGDYTVCAKGCSGADILCWYSNKPKNVDIDFNGEGFYYTDGCTLHKINAEIVAWHKIPEYRGE